MLILTYAAEIRGELTFTALIGQIWALPLLIAMVALNLATTNAWTMYSILLLLLIYPNGEWSVPFDCHGLAVQAVCAHAHPYPQPILSR